MSIQPFQAQVIRRKYISGSDGFLNDINMKIKKSSFVLLLLFLLLLLLLLQLLVHSNVRNKHQNQSLMQIKTYKFLKYIT
jgi:hypothetical protein